jgi:hypothetical protein
MISRLKQLIRIGVISNQGQDAGKVPIQQVSYHGKLGNGIAWFPYGFHAVAKNDTLCLILAANANSEERVHIPTSMPDRPTLKPGEACLYHPDTGAIVKMDSDGNISMTAPEITINGNLTVTGTIDATDEITSGSITMTGHRHTITGGSSAGTTSTGSG